MRIYKGFLHTDFFRLAFLISNIVRNKTLYTECIASSFFVYLYMCVLYMSWRWSYETPQMYALHVTITLWKLKYRVQIVIDFSPRVFTAPNMKWNVLASAYIFSFASSYEVMLNYTSFCERKLFSCGKKSLRSGAINSNFGRVLLFRKCPPQTTVIYLG